MRKQLPVGQLLANKLIAAHFLFARNKLINRSFSKLSIVEENL
jgi:hypothetical protein